MIFVTHVFFQLYHCSFDKIYLEQIYKQGRVSKGATLCSTPPYDIRNRSSGELVDILVALIQYLKSGESKVANLGNVLTKNVIHKVVIFKAHAYCSYTRMLRLQPKLPLN